MEKSTRSAAVMQGVFGTDGFFSSEMNRFIETCEGNVRQEFLKLYFDSESDYTRYLLIFSVPLPSDFYQFSFPVSFVPFGTL